MEHFIADDGEHIHLKVGGDGPPMVMLHGWTSTHRDWNPFVRAFSADHRVFRWDARAHGGHRRLSPSVPTVERMARDLHNLLCQRDLRQVVAVGHSMGALTLLQYLRDYGAERLSRIVVIDQSPKLITDEEWRLGIYGDFDWSRNVVFMRELERDFAEAVLRLVADGFNQDARRRYLENGADLQAARERLRRLDAKPLIDCWASLTAADYRDLLERIPVPVLLVFGSASNFYLLETARLLRDTIPQAALEVYPEVDHAPHLWLQERFIRDVLSFIEAGAGEPCVLGA